MDIPDQPSVDTLFALFPGEGKPPSTALVSAEEVPQPYRRLLCHEHHMTVTVEAFHGDLVDVVVLASRRDGNFYSRKILLQLQKSRRIVQFGIVRINLAYCSPEVRDAIIAEKTPLGRVLIENNVFRRIEPTAYLRVEAGPDQQKWFQTQHPGPYYGRLAWIHCDDRPAIELLEIVAPEKSS